MKKLAVIFLATLFTLGCASKRTESDTALAKKAHVPVYGAFSYNKKRLKLEYISASPTRSGGFFSVNLLDKSPHNLNTRTKACNFAGWKAKYGAGENKCIRGPFRKIGMNAATVPTYLFGGVVTFGLGWLFGVTTVDSYFDWTTYEKELDLALQKNNLSEAKIIAISREFADIMQIQEQASQLCYWIEKKSREFEQTNHEKYTQALRGLVRVKDRSGFSSSNSIDWASELKLLVEVRGPITPTSNCTEESLKLYPDERESTHDQLAGILSSEKSRLKAVQTDKVQYEDSLKGGGVLHITCPQEIGSVLNSFHFKSSCPKSVRFEQGNLTGNPQLLIEVDSRDFRDVRPKSYVSKDSNIEITLSGSQIKIKNLTDKYIAVERLSLYYGTDVLTKGNLGAGTLIELPPMSFEKLSIYDFDLDALEDDYRNLTQEKAQQIQVLFSISAKYSVTNSDVKHSLHKPEHYSLKALL